MEIKLQNVTKYYQDGDKSTKGIENISLSFDTDGSFVVITGESGAGKSTLIRVLTGLEDFDEGEITFDGVPLSGMSDEERHELYSKNISFVFQDYNLVESFTAKENVKLALVRSGEDLRSAEKKAMDVLKQVGLEKQANFRTSKLSGGERQRVAIARSLALETKVIIFDEPTGNLDQNTSKEIIDLIKSISKGRLIIYVTHEFYQVQDVVTRHIILKDGSVESDSILKKPEKEEENVSISAKSRKYSFLGKVYSSLLFAFRRPGRFLVTVLVLFLTALACFGTAAISGLTYGGLDYLVRSKTVGSGIGNEVVVTKEDYQADEIQVQGDVFEDRYDLLKRTDFALTISSYIDDGMDFYGSDYYKVNSFFPRSNLLPYFNIAYEKGKSCLKEGKGMVYLVMPKASYSGDNYQVKEMNDMIGSKVYLNPTYISSEESLSSMKTYFFDKVDRLTFAGIYYSDKLISNQYYYYIPDSDTFSSYFHKFESFYVDYYSPLSLDNVNIQISDSKPDYDISYMDNGKRIEFETILRKIPNQVEGRTGFSFDPFWKDKEDEVMIRFNDFEFPLSSLKNKSYEESHEPTGTFAVILCSSNLLELEVGDSGYRRRYYFKDSGKISDFEKSVDSKSYSVSVLPKLSIQYTNKKTINNMSVSTRISVLMSFVTLLFILFLILLLIKRILNNFYYRKGNDQMVLGYIGYSFKDTLLINLCQFLTLAVLSNVIIYPILFSNSFILQLFLNFPAFFLFTAFLDLLFSVYLSMPIRKRRKK